MDELEEVPDGATVIFSAHGVSRAVQQEASSRKLSVLDATCPLVTKVHTEVKKFRDEGREVILIGHAGHPEVEGTLGQVEGGVFWSRLSTTQSSFLWRIQHCWHMSLRRHFLLMIPRRLLTYSRLDFQIFRRLDGTISVTRLKTGKMQSNVLRLNVTRCLWLVR